MTAIDLHDVRGRTSLAWHGPLHRGLARVSHAIFATLREWRRRMHDRTQLGALSDSMLRDIGISPAEATSLSSKPLWKE